MNRLYMYLQDGCLYELIEVHVNGDGVRVMYKQYDSPRAFMDEESNGCLLEGDSSIVCDMIEVEW